MKTGFLILTTAITLAFGLPLQDHSDIATSDISVKKREQLVSALNDLDLNVDNVLNNLDLGVLDRRDDTVSALNNLDANVDNVLNNADISVLKRNNDTSPV
jgi:hypothetical protein